MASLGSSSAILAESSQQLESARMLSNIYGNLYHLNCFSTTAGFFLVLDQTNTPNTGDTVKPKLVYSVPANGTLAFTWEIPLKFKNGIMVLFSSNSSPFTYTASQSAFISGGVV